MQRIVSLLPSLTETVCALGLEPRLVGRSHECDTPSRVTRLPVCTEPRFDVEGSSAEIDARVKGVVRDGLSVYRVFPDLLRELEPDLILTQDQCEVCAVSLGDVERAVAEWLGASARDRAPRLLSLAPRTLGDVWGDVIRVAEAADVGERGRALVAELTDRVTTIGEGTGSRRARPRVACLEWLDPLMGAGNWMPELVTLAGGDPLFGEAGQHSPWISWAEIAAADPDLIIAMPCGFDLARTRAELAALETRPEWTALRAVREGRVHAVDGNAYMNRPGPRLVDSLEILAQRIAG